MTPEHATHPSPADETARPSRLGRLVLAVVFLTATAAAFALVWATVDDTLGQKQRRARAQIRRLEGYFQAFHRTTGRFPSEAESFTPLLQAGVLDAAPVDPWGNPYLYRMQGPHGYVLSLGADGRPGGSGDAADVSSGGLLLEVPR